MVLKHSLQIVALLLVLFGMAGPASAQHWTVLGERTVRDTVDYDTIPVTVARGGFRRLKFTVRNHAIRFIRVRVRYGNGAPDLKEIRMLIPAGGESRVIDLRGGDRVIRYVDFWYEAKSLGVGGRALIRVFAMR